ncbi:MAG: peptidylprolyl isomerase [Gammaproteobacteria bacterium]|nr:peptidylprolyl isomerase [Gammaproteobacteria bacterium]
MTKYLQTGIISAVLLLGANAHADVVATVEGKNIDDKMLEVVANARLQKPLSAVTAQEREQLTEELVQLFVLSSAAEKNKLHRDPTTAMQLELQRRTLLAQKMLANHIESNPVTEAEIQQAYDERFSTSQMEFKARHILVESPGEADAVIEQLKGGADFAALAAEKSTGPSANSGGDLGWFGAGQMVQPFSAAVASMDKGSFSTAPVQTQFGWHVILKEDERTVSPPELDAVRQGIERALGQQKAMTFVNNLREDAKVTRK